MDKKRKNTSSITHIIGVIRSLDNEKETKPNSREYPCPYCGSSNTQVYITSSRDESSYKCKDCLRIYKVRNLKKSEDNKVSEDKIDYNDADKWISDAVNDICKTNNINQNNPKELMEYLLKDYISHHKNDGNETSKKDDSSNKYLSSIDDINMHIIFATESVVSINYIGPRGKGRFTATAKSPDDLTEKWIKFCAANGYDSIAHSKIIESYEFNYTLNQKRYRKIVHGALTNIMVKNGIWNSKIEDDNVRLYLLKSILSDFQDLRIEYPHIRWFKTNSGTFEQTMFKYLFNRDEIIENEDAIKEAIFNG